MFYYASKIFWLVAQPSSLITLTILAGLILTSIPASRRIGLRLAWGGLAAMLVVGFLPVGNLLIHPLEERFAGEPLPPPEAEVAGLIILGGFEDGWVSASRPGLAVNEAAERLTEGLRLARRYPRAQVIFTGGVGGLFAGGTDAAGPVGDFLTDVGIAAERIRLESRSANTWQNATMTRELLQPPAGARYLLVTSAYHMPRAIGVFRQAGFTVVAAPTDYRTRDARDLSRLFPSLPAGLERADLAAKEWVGLLAYYLTGRSSALFPAPVADAGR